MKLLYAVLLVGCGSGGDQHTVDARAIDAHVDAVVDAVPDAPADAKTCPPLLVGGSDVSAQGWTVTQQAPATLTYGADYAQLVTSTTGAVGGQLLLVRANTLTPGQPFTLRAELEVMAVNPHNVLDSAAAILGSFAGGFGTTAERGEMIYIDPDKIGFADDTASANHTLDTTGFHTYELSVDSVGTATVSLDGVPLLSRLNYTTNGTIAIGDQSNDANLDSSIRVRSVIKLCD